MVCIGGTVEHKVPSAARRLYVWSASLDVVENGFYFEHAGAHVQRVNVLLDVSDARGAQPLEVRLKGVLRGDEQWCSCWSSLLLVLM